MLADLRYALRALVRTPGFTLVAVFSLDFCSPLWLVSAVSIMVSIMVSTCLVSVGVSVRVVSVFCSLWVELVSVAGFSLPPPLPPLPLPLPLPT